MQLIDTHCHIHSQDYPLSLEEVEQRAAEANVTQLICVGTDADDSRRAVEFVRNRENHWASIGVHPHEAKSGEEELQKLALLLNAMLQVTPGGADEAREVANDKIVAIGECGLDYFYGHSSKADQETALRFQIELALEHGLPLIFHVRDAFDDFWPIFDSYQGLRGVMHSFTDTRQNLDKLLERGLYVGINGITTFTKNSWQLKNAKILPLERLLIETDAPYLTPVPYRGKVNEPAHVRRILEFLASLRNQSLEEVATATTHNARQLFSI
jgi:TatD DNase family protein